MRGVTLLRQRPARPGTDVAERMTLGELAEQVKFGGQWYGSGYASTGKPMTTWGDTPAEPIADNFAGYVQAAFGASSVVSALEMRRCEVFSQARFQFQEIQDGRPGRLFGTPSLTPLERPWLGGTTGDLLVRMLLDADLAGNSYWVQVAGEMLRLRPDWVEILLEPRLLPYGPDGRKVPVGFRKVGFLYWDGGKGYAPDPAVFLPDEIAHFAPIPDPLAYFRGMSWITPTIREIQADKLTTEHKLKFFENAATPNLAVVLPKELTPEQFDKYVDLMAARSRGLHNAYETLYVGAGSDVVPIGADLKQIDFKVTQGAGETRIAAAAGVPVVIAGFSEGTEGSSLNAGNYDSAKKLYRDTTVANLLRNVCGTLEPIVRPPGISRLWYDVRDISFFRDDEKALAEIQAERAKTIRQLIESGFEPASVVEAVESEDMTRLVHTGYVSVQLQLPGSKATPDQPALPAA